MAGNRNLHDSAKNKQDEFYTNRVFRVLSKNASVCPAVQR